MAKILVTGGLGYIGSLLCEELLKAGHWIVCIDNMMYNQWALSIHKTLSLFPRFKFINSDILNGEHYAALEEADCIFHLAALVGAPVCDKHPEYAVRVNMGATHEIVKRMNSSQRIIYPNTNSGYGTTAPGVTCTEETPLAPISIYAESKYEGEKIVLAHENSIVFRLATVFGCSYRTRFDLLVNNFAYLAHFNGEIPIFEGDFRRNFVHVRDVVNAMVFSMENLGKQEVYNLGNDGENTTKVELANKIAGYCGAKVTMMDKEDKDKRDYVVSSKKLEIAGFKAKYDLEYGLGELHEMFEGMSIEENCRETLLKYLYKNV